MRELKFRQPLYYKGKFIEWHYWGHIDFGFVVPIAMDLERLSQQYIGLKDKNGKEQCEGNICEMIILGDREQYLKYNNNNIKGALVIIEIKNLTPGFISVFPELQHPDDKEWKSFWQCEDGEWWDEKYFKIIGNTVENPELLEEG